MAIAHAEVKSDLDGELDILPSSHLTNLPSSLSKDACLWTLLEGSMRQGFPHHSMGELSDASFFGKQRVENHSYLWFAWPEIENTHSGAVASTEKPGQ